MKETDEQTSQAHRQTDRVTVIRVSSVAIGRNVTKDRYANHATCGNKRHRGPTKHRIGRIGPMKCIVKYKMHR